MHKSIFEIESRFNKEEVINKMFSYFYFFQNTTFCPTEHRYFTLIDAIDIYAFKKWPYRDLTLTSNEYLESKGLINFDFFVNNVFVEENFLIWAEFIKNITTFAISKGYVQIENVEINAELENLGNIIEKLNYKFIQDGDKYILVKRDVDVDTTLDLVDQDTAMLLLEYNDVRIKNDVNVKRNILKGIDRYIDANKTKFKQKDNTSFESAEFINNNFGVNHLNDKINKLGLTDAELIEWYDKAFTLLLCSIRNIKVKPINDEIADFKQEQGFLNSKEEKINET